MQGLEQQDAGSNSALNVWAGLLQSPEAAVLLAAAGVPSPQVAGSMASAHRAAMIAASAAHRCAPRLLLPGLVHGMLDEVQTRQSCMPPTVNELSCAFRTAAPPVH